MLNRQQTIAIKQMMIAAEMSQKTLAETMGVTRQYLNALINGKEDNPLQELRVMRLVESAKEKGK